MKDAYFAGGCFWCITPVFAEHEGVESVRCGYSGGEEENPAYEEVKHQETGHRESIRVRYDPEKVTYRTLLELFLANVDPFDGKGQYIDRGHSYTLAVYFGDEKERAEAEDSIVGLEVSSGKKVFVSLEPFTAFYDAEEYHQDYYRKNPEAFARELTESGRIGRGT